MSLFNFRSFKGENTVGLSPKGLYGVIGSYVGQEDVSNGAGKTSFIMGINYLLLINELPATELQNWQDETPFYVKGEFDLDQEPLEITRGAGKFEINYRNKTLVGEEAKAYLKQLLLEPYILEKLIYRPQQSEGIFVPMSSSERYQFLYDITDLKNIEIIIDKSKQIILQKANDMIQFKLNKISQEEKLSWHQNQISKINEQVKEIQQKVYSTEGKLVSLVEPKEQDYEVSVNHLQKQINSLKETEPKEPSFFDEQAINRIEEEIAQLKNSPILSVDDEYSRRISFLNDELSKETSYKQSITYKIDNIVLEVNIKSSNILSNELQIQECSEAVGIKNQYEQAVTAKEKTLGRHLSLAENKCPECHSVLNEQHLSEVKEKHQKELQIFETSIKLYLNNKQIIDNTINLINQNSQLKNEIDALNHEKQSLNLELSEIQNKINLFSQSIENCKKTCEIELNSLTEKRQGKLNLLNNQLASTKNRFKTDFLTAKNKWLTEMSKLETQLNSQVQANSALFQKTKSNYENSKVEYQTKINSFKGEIERAKSTLYEFNEQIVLIEKNIADTIKDILENELSIKLETEICSALGKSGFSGAYLFDILNYLTELTNKNLNTIPIMDRFSVVIDSEKVLKNLNTKPDIDIKIFNADKEISYKALSGGQKQAMSWCIDQGIDELISEKHNKVFNWKVLDEPFSALDLNGKQNAMEFLRRYAADKLILITDHGKILNDSLDGEIKISFEHQKSSFVA